MQNVKNPSKTFAKRSNLWNLCKKCLNTLKYVCKTISQATLAEFSDHLRVHSSLRKSKGNFCMCTAKPLKNKSLLYDKESVQKHKIRKKNFFFSFREKRKNFVVGAFWIWGAGELKFEICGGWRAKMTRKWFNGWILLSFRDLGSSYKPENSENGPRGSFKVFLTLLVPLTPTNFNLSA